MLKQLQRQRGAHREHADSDGIKNPRATRMVGSLRGLDHRNSLLGMRGTNIHQCRRRDFGKQSCLGRNVRHRWGRTDREQDVGGEVGHHRVRQALNERCALAQSLKEGADVSRAETVGHRAALRSADDGFREINSSARLPERCRLLLHPSNDLLLRQATELIADILRDPHGAELRSAH